MKGAEWRRGLSSRGKGERNSRVIKWDHKFQLKKRKNFHTGATQEWTGLMWFYEYLIPNGSILKVQSTERYTKIGMMYNWQSICIKEDSTCLVDERVTCGVYTLWVNR